MNFLRPFQDFAGMLRARDLHYSTVKVEVTESLFSVLFSELKLRDESIIPKPPITLYGFLEVYPYSEKAQLLEDIKATEQKLQHLKDKLEKEAAA